MDEAESFLAAWEDHLVAKELPSTLCDLDQLQLKCEHNVFII